jgi:RNase P subunit RPR2
MASKGIKAKCEKCKKNIIVEQKDIHTRKLGGGIEEVFFKCSKCDTTYRVALTDERIREIHKTLPFVDFDTAIKLRIELKERMDELNKK